MRYSLISAAVAAALASAAAGAANVDLFISGSSAASDFIGSDMATSICGGSAPQKFTAGAIAGSPDDIAYRCLATSATLPTNVHTNDVVTIHYSRELGSLWGISPFIPSYVDGGGHTHLRTTQRLFVNPDGLDCGGNGVAGANLTGQTCTALTTYSNKTETFTSPHNDELVTASPDVGVSDQNFEQFSLADNWVQVQDANPANNYTVLDSYTIVGGSPVYDQLLPTLTQLHTLSTSANAKIMNGQVFSVIVNNGGPAAALGNLSKTSLTSIFSGVYNNWKEVPELAGAAAANVAIKVCRRDHGSGSQVTSSIYFTGTECGVAGAPRFVSASALNGLGTNGGTGTTALGVANVQEDTSTGNVRTCVQNTPGAIGITGLGIGANYTTLSIDGVQPNAHNTAAGSYTYAGEDWVYDNTSNTQGASSAAHYLWSTVFTNARKASNLFAFKPETGALQANGLWLVNEGAGDKRSGYYALPITLVNTASVAAWNTITAAPVALGTVNGNNCNIRVNKNTL